MNLLETIVQWDKELFLTLNGLHSSWMDHFMWLMSETLIWLPFYALFLFFLVRNKKSGSILLLLFFALLIVFADQIASGVFKPLIGRLRPTHEPELAGLVHIVNNYRGGHFGFFSSHGANVFAFAGFSLFLVRNPIYSVVILLWAFLVSYSRIYLGVHYPMDIFCGALFGFLSSIGFYQLYLLLSDGNKHKHTKKQRPRKITSLLSQKESGQTVLIICTILITCLIASFNLTWH
jgi:undecaprenyl-diphosphatase